MFEHGICGWVKWTFPFSILCLLLGFLFYCRCFIKLRMELFFNIDWFHKMCWIGGCFVVLLFKLVLEINYVVWVWSYDVGWGLDVNFHSCDISYSVLSLEMSSLRRFNDTNAVEVHGAVTIWVFCPWRTIYRFAHRSVRGFLPCPGVERD